jgi:hypothetical protein
MKTLPIINQLKARCTLFGGRVYGLKEWIDLNQKPDLNPRSMPCCWVVCTQESANEQTSAVSYYQTVTATFDVFVAVPKVDAHGQVGADTLDDVASSVRKALMGFAPVSDNFSAMSYLGFTFLKPTGPWAMIDMQFSSSYELNQTDSHIQTAIDEMPSFERTNLDVDFIREDGKPDGKIEYSTKFNVN